MYLLHAAGTNVPPMPSVNRWIVGLLLGVLVLAVDLPGIAVGDFVGDDEALDAGVVWEMRHSGDWLFPEFNGEYLTPKPPLFYWSAALASVIHGTVDEWSLRAPSAVAAAATVTVTAAGGATLIGVAPAAFGGLMLATMPMVFREARGGRCDMLLTLLVTGCLLIACKRGELSRGARWGFWSLLGLAALTKGGAGVGLVIVVVVAAAAVSRDRQAITRLVDRSMIAFFVIGGWWYVLAAAHWGYRFVDEQIVGENLHHLLGGSGISDKGSGTTPLLEHLSYYPLRFFPQTAPWGVLAALAARDLWRGDPRVRDTRFLAVWLFAGLAFFTVVSRKSPYYMLPLMPAVALLAAAWAIGGASELARPRVALVPPARVSAVIAAAGALVWLAARTVTSASCDVQAAAAALGDEPVVTILLVTALGAATLVALRAGRSRDWAAATISLSVALAAALMLSGRISGRIDDCASLRPFATEVREKTTTDDRVVFFQSPLPAVILYAQRRIPTLRPGQEPPAAPFYLIVPQSLDPELPDDWRDRAQVVATGHGRVFTRKLMDIRLLRIDLPRSGDERDDVPVGSPPAAQEVRYP